MTAKCFKPMYGLCTKTSDDLDRSECVLGLPDKYRAKLCQQLGNNHYTYLVLTDGLCHEIVKVEFSHGLLFIERAQDCTDKENWPCGTQVKFDWTLGAIRDLKDLAEPKPDPECPEELFSGEIKNGNCTVKFEDGVAVKSTPNKQQLADGCYDEPVITFEDGCIVKVGEGDKTVNRSLYSMCSGHSGCRCTKCQHY